MEECPLAEYVNIALSAVKTTKNTQKSYLQKKIARIQVQRHELAAAATPLEITLIVRLVNNIVP
jgi:hypothetical protein